MGSSVADALKPYRGYNATVNPGISIEFSTPAFRMGHSMLGEDEGFLSDDSDEVHAPIDLRESFFNSPVLIDTGIEPMLKYLASDRSQEIDTFIVDDLRNFLFGQPGQGGLDLAALNIQRGRDHGLADYNSMRAAVGLPRVTSFTGISSDAAVQSALQSVYASVDDVDAWVGGLAEDHIPGASVGALFSRVMVDQFRRLRDGDRYWYEGPAGRVHRSIDASVKVCDGAFEWCQCLSWLLWEFRRDVAFRAVVSLCSLIEIAVVCIRCFTELQAVVGHQAQHGPS